jgi:hypothetical protein
MAGLIDVVNEKQEKVAGKSPEQAECSDKLQLCVASNDRAAFKAQDPANNSPDIVEPARVKKADFVLPPLQIVATAQSGKLDDRVVPWGEGSNLHPNYQMAKDGLVKIGEGPHHVATRLLGADANSNDVKALTKAMGDQFRQDYPGQDIRVGESLLNEKNVIQVLSRITDEASRNRIIDKLKINWNESDPPAAVQFEAHGRPGETHPSKIDPDLFLKDIAAAAIDVKAAEYRARGQCAAGARLAFNELPMWHIDGGTVDKSINKDINGWRSGVQLAKDLAETGLFDVVPLAKLGYKNLKEGYIVGRYHDIDIMTKKHRPPNDDSDMYHDSFVLIPKRKPAEPPKHLNLS